MGGFYTWVLHQAGGAFSVRSTSEPQPDGLHGAALRHPAGGCYTCVTLRRRRAPRALHLCHWLPLPGTSVDLGDAVLA
eukprot:281448-Pyramimonas_sp.AAC.1